MRILLSSSIVVAVGLILGGCAVSPPNPSAASPSAATTPAVTVSGAPSPSAPSPSSVLPDATGAINVGAWPSNGFLSPSGHITCVIAKDWARCDLPDNFTGTTPPSSQVCPEAGLDVTSVYVDTQTDYFCAGDPASFPSPGSEDARWWKGRGFGTVKAYDNTMVVLPYGQKLLDGDVVCASQTTGVSCINLKLKTGFRVARAGITFFRP